MITCSKCAKENQDHYKFCLGCGAELPRDGGPQPSVAKPAPQPAPAPAAPAPARAAAAPASSRGSAPVAAATGAGTACPQCGHINGPGNVFCGSCGFRLGPTAAPPPAAAPTAPEPVAPPSAGGLAVTLTALRPDGSIAGTYTFPGLPLTIGRETGGVFAGDSYLSPRHSSFRAVNGKLFVKDEASLNGVYRKLVRDVPVELRPADIFRIGQEIIRFEPLQPETPSPDGVERIGSPAKGYVGRIALLIGRETTGNAFPVPDSGLQLGRERGDVLFPEDGYVSGLHCHIGYTNGKTSITDLGSSNGSFYRLREETEISGGEVLLMGQQLFRVDLS